jgi:hypothetical protein
MLTQRYRVSTLLSSEVAVGSSASDTRESGQCRRTVAQSQSVTLSTGTVKVRGGKLLNHAALLQLTLRFDNSYSVLCTLEPSLIHCSKYGGCCRWCRT